MLSGIYRQFLRFYPEPFREQYGPAMLQVLHEELAGAAGLKRVGIWARHFLDLPESAVREWLAEAPSPEAGALRMSPESIEEVARTRARNSHILGFCSFAFAGLVTYLLYANGKQGGSFFLAFYWSAYFPLLQLELRRARKYWRSYAVTVEPEELTIYTSQGHFAIRRESIVGAVDSPLRGLSIRREHAKDVLIPAGLEGYELVRAQVGKWHKVDYVPFREGRIFDI